MEASELDRYEMYVTAMEDYNASDIANDEYIMTFQEWLEEDIKNKEFKRRALNGLR